MTNLSSLRPIIEELEIYFSKLNQHFYGGELETPIINVAPNNRKILSLGACTFHRVWKDTDTNSTNKGSYEIKICAHALELPKEDVLEVLLHEMAHLYCSLNEITDTNQNGTYHNGRYRKVAEAHGLLVMRDKKYGWSITSLNDEAKAFLNCPPGSKFEIYRPDNKMFMSISRQPRKRTPKYLFVCPGDCGERIEVDHKIHVTCSRCKQKLKWENRLSMTFDSLSSSDSPTVSADVATITETLMGIPITVEADTEVSETQESALTFY